MKRIATLLLAAGLLLGASSAAQAADVKLSGVWDFQFVHSDMSFSKDNNTKDRFGAMQRLRTKIDIIASENLKGVVGLEIGTSQWGKQKDGMGYGDRPNNAIKLRWSYVDWVVPATDLKVRMGKQPFATPAFTFGSTIMDRNGTGIVASYDFNENVGMTVSWLRAENDNSGLQHDAFDLFGVTVPMKFDGFKATPYAYVGSAGENSLQNINGENGRWDAIANNMLGYQAGNGLAGNKRAVPWWVGIATELSMFDPFSFALDGAYGSIDMGNNGNQDIKRSGWYVAALAQYKLDMMTPGLGFWYGSGDDDDSLNGSERMPSLQSCFTPTDFGFDGFWYETGDAISQRASGTWGVMGQLKDISFMEDLTHKFIVAYYRGTNHKDAVVANTGFKSLDGTDSVYLTKGDSAFEVDFQTKYDIYKDLALVVDLGYIRLSVDDDVWNTDDVSKNAYKAAVNMRYSF